MQLNYTRLRAVHVSAIRRRRRRHRVDVCIGQS